MANTNHENRGLRALCSTYDDWLPGINRMLNTKINVEDLYMKLDDLTFDFNKMLNNKNDCISRKGAMQEICEILMDIPDSEFQEGEMAGMIRAMKAVKNMTGIEPPKAEIIRSELKPAFLGDVIDDTSKKLSAHPSYWDEKEEDIVKIIHVIHDAGYVICKKEED